MTMVIVMMVIMNAIIMAGDGYARGSDDTEDNDYDGDDDDCDSHDSCW